MILLLIGIYGALRHPIITVKSWWETLNEKPPTPDKG
jgi:hypothetical protein